MTISSASCVNGIHLWSVVVGGHATGTPCLCGAVSWGVPPDQAPAFDVEGLILAIRLLRGGSVLLPVRMGSGESRGRKLLDPELEAGNRWRANAAAHLEAALESHLRAGTMAVRDALQFRAFLKTLSGRVGAMAQELERAASGLKKQGQATAASRAHVAALEAFKLAQSIDG